MAEEEVEVTWDEAIKSGNFIKFEEIRDGKYKAKVIKIVDWKLIKAEKTFDEKTEKVVEFIAKAIEEDGLAVEKTFSTTSNRLKRELKDILEDKSPAEPIKIEIQPVGKNYNRQYSVKQVE